MADKSRVTFSKLKDLIFEHLEDTVGGLEDVEVTFAKLEKGEWRANVDFVPEGEDSDQPESALFTIDAESGEVTEFKRGHTWRE